MRRLLLVAGATSVLLLAAACGDDADSDGSVASAGGESAQAEQTEEPSREEAMQRFVDCMRENGVEDMPDPSAGGGIELRREVGEDPDFEAAQEACQDEMPVRGDGELDEESQELVLEFAGCMRENGVEDMPDPSAGGGMLMDPSIADDPDFEAALATCQHILEDLR